MEKIKKAVKIFACIYFLLIIVNFLFGGFMSSVLISPVVLFLGVVSVAFLFSDIEKKNNKTPVKE